MLYTIAIKKTIVVHVNADSDYDARQIAYDRDSTGWDGMWDSAEPELEIIEKENDDEDI